MDFLNNVTLIINAGGGSTRMGQDKALVHYKGKRVIDHIIEKFSFFKKKLIISNSEDHRYKGLQIPVFGDEIKDKGPLCGIYTGLKNMTTHWGFLVACDMPHVSESLARRQLLVASRVEADAVVPKGGKYRQPLHALYSKNCIEPVKESLDSNNLRIISFYEKVKVHYFELTEDEITSLKNFNTMKELLSEESNE